MNKNQLTTVSEINTLAWVLPLPVWPSLKLHSKPLRHTYTLSNQSPNPIQITQINLEGEDERLGWVGGTCHIGLTLQPAAECTLIFQVTPSRLGTSELKLNIQHSGHFSPLWTDIVFAVVVVGEARRDKRGYLADDTRNMDRKRRQMEQDGHRRFARVHARHHPEQEAVQQNLSHEGELQNNILQNPWLNSQRFDGIDPNLNPEPPLNSAARTEFDNERREQEMEKQLRLGNMPKFSTAPKPQPY